MAVPARLLLLSALLPALVLPAATYLPVEWGSVPATSTERLTPLGCACQDPTRSGGEACTFFNCDCPCNLQAGVCDANCCCDTECTATEREIFALSGTCSGDSNSTKKSGIRYCLDGSQAVAVNPTGALKMDPASTAANPLESVLCVVLENNPSKGRYFADPGVQLTSVMDKDTVKRAFSFTPDASEANAATAPAITGTTYAVGAPVTVKFPVTDARFGAKEIPRTNVLDGAFAVPRAGLNGLCDDRFHPGYRTDVPREEGGCARHVPASATEGLQPACADIFATQRFVTSVRLGKMPNANAGEAAQWVSVGGNITYFGMNETTGTYDESTGALVTSYDVATCTCSNAVMAVDYALTYDPDTGNLVSATANVYTQRINNGGKTAAQVAAAVAVATAANTTVPVCTAASATTTYQQSFSVAFSSSGSGSVARSFDGGNIVNRTMSGNPGYITGLPVLAGHTETIAMPAVAGVGATTKTAIQARVHGMEVLFADMSSKEAGRYVVVVCVCVCVLGYRE